MAKNPNSAAAFEGRNNGDNIIYQLCLMFHDKKHGVPISNLEAVGFVVVKGLNLPLGKLASDHLGYMSFDLEHVNASFAASSFVKKELGLSVAPTNIGDLLGSVDIRLSVKQPMSVVLIFTEN
ncbi:hypothetical protein LB566_26560 [Mesorhizobium sp. CA13]|uniref:hypothetical protein n=1 Tax=Mesorhizobium sp. CA13 TaxID=2876643 RepID=UPI001CCDB196|nr:hypothetical protein [Mesorhizobium sp. CA13]MBZ9857358.1 hypothetical protein [Mesorhizobium sp. CA13]